MKSRRRDTKERVEILPQMGEAFPLGGVPEDQLRQISLQRDIMDTIIKLALKMHMYVDSRHADP